MRSERWLTRFAVKAPVEFNLSDPEKRFFGFAMDISEGGAFIETPFPAPPVSEVALRVWPWGWGEEVVLIGVVRWEDSRGMGVEFLSVSAREARAIQTLVADWGRPREAPVSQLS